MSLRETARSLRADLTGAERRLWGCLRGRALGPKFRRQVPLGRYIVDFASFDARLVIEVDGGQHLEEEATDVARDAWLRSRGFRVVRFWNDEVMENLDGVVEVLAEVIRGSTPHPDPPPQGGREKLR